ncbi:hypothetical protein HMPREF1982_04340 [Clostridiales bacterium oral taxon 876 str. F0540]|nr:hypothetical protein HMPREF1982_04340 [Clostridiales bacterium oral taxon 876 str. F0540]
MKKNIKLSDDKLRQIVDGFNLDDTEKYNKQNFYITTDQGVYNAPDDELKSSKKE